MKRFLTAPEVAGEYPVATQTLARWRCDGSGPAFLRIGRKIAYDRQVLDEWFAAHSVRSTSDYTALANARRG